MALGTSPCYGDPEWDAAVLVETNGISLPLFEALLATNGFADMEALAAAIAVLAACIDIKDDEGGGCEDSEDLYDYW